MGNRGNIDIELNHTMQFDNSLITIGVNIPQDGGVCVSASCGAATVTCLEKALIYCIDKSNIVDIITPIKT
jgi:galactokinase